jgi:hypothetical protein
MLADVAIFVDVPSFLLVVGKNIALFWLKRHVHYSVHFLKRFQSVGYPISSSNELMAPNVMSKNGRFFNAEIS